MAVGLAKIKGTKKKLLHKSYHVLVKALDIKNCSANNAISTLCRSVHVHVGKK